MRTKLALTVTAALLGLTGCGGGDASDEDSTPSESATPAPFQAAYDTCEQQVADSIAKIIEGSGETIGAEAVMRVGDGGDSLTVAPLDQVAFLVEPSVTAAVCVLEALDAPDAVVSEVQQVSGIDGRQETSWGGVELKYSYDGNVGFTGVFTQPS